MYKNGDKVGPYDIILLERTEKTSSGHWKAKFICPFHDDNTHIFETYINTVVSGKIWNCGCRRKINNDLTGKTFGRLTVLYPTSQRQNNAIVYHCQCECGNTKNVSSRCLNNGSVQSCGCLAKESFNKVREKRHQQHIKDITNQKSGTWTALYRLNEKNSSGNYYWYCVCENGHYNRIDTGNWGKIKTCKQCKTGYSVGELAIQQILSSLNVRYKEEYIFNNCIFKRPLRFDFYLPDYNCCIEYDGIQHFQPTKFSHDSWDIRRQRDNIKNQYCKDHNIILIRIPYYDLDKLNNEYFLDLLEKNGIILI